VIRYWIFDIGDFAIYREKHDECNLMTKTILLDDLEIYKLAMEIGDNVWDIVMRWSYFPKKTLGSQYTEAADSIAANIAEGYGRYFYKDRKQFCYYSRGSIMETKTWTNKAFKRELITLIELESLIEKLKVLHHKLNSYIKTLKQNFQ
jgi:four helix bundle protein